MTKLDEKINYNTDITGLKTLQNSIYNKLEIDKESYNTIISKKISETEKEQEKISENLGTEKSNAVHKSRENKKALSEIQKIEKEFNKKIKKKKKEKLNELIIIFKELTDEYIEKNLIYIKSQINEKKDQKEKYDEKIKNLDEEEKEKITNKELLVLEETHISTYIKKIETMLKTIESEKLSNNKKIDELNKLEILFTNIFNYNDNINKKFEEMEFNSYQNKILYFIIKDSISKIIPEIMNKTNKNSKILNEINEYFIKKKYNFLKEIQKYNDNIESNYFFESYNKHIIEIENKINNLLLSVNSNIINYSNKNIDKFNKNLSKKIDSIKNLEPNIEIIFDNKYKYRKLNRDIKNNKINIPPYTNIYFIYIIFLLIIVDYLTLLYE